jgi:carbon monoxide dehydrogenase subunit G
LKVKLERTFAVPAPVEQAWQLLRDLERVTACMPGARITERSDDRHYKGTVAVKLGPASMAFRGELEVLALEPATRTLHLIGKGTDATGGSAAAMDLTARVEALDAASCNLIGRSEVSLSGKAAAFGGRMAESVAEQVLRQFAANFAAALSAAAPAAGADGAAAAAPAAAPPTQLNGLALLWGVLLGWLRSLFGLRGA